jgi:hypothetical protein
MFVGSKREPIFDKKKLAYLLLAFLKVNMNQFVIRKATFGESQADAIGVGRTESTIKSKSWHFRAA